MNRETLLVAQVLLFWFYTSTLTHSVSKRIYMMTGHERRLMWLGIGEAVANLALSITLVLIFPQCGQRRHRLAHSHVLLWLVQALAVDGPRHRHPSAASAARNPARSVLCCLPAVLILGIAPHFPPLQGGLAALHVPSMAGMAAIVTVWALWQAP
jgi:hypothetical protein